MYCLYEVVVIVAVSPVSVYLYHRSKMQHKLKQIFEGIKGKAAKRPYRTKCVSNKRNNDKVQWKFETFLLVYCDLGHQFYPWFVT